jgi:hypothetical protein
LEFTKQEEKVPQCDSTMVDNILNLAQHAEIAHHIPGRIRLKVRLSGVELFLRIDGQSLLRNIPGVLNATINPLARSAVIEYDPKLLPSDLWEDFVKVNEPRARTRIRNFLEADGNGSGIDSAFPGQRP